MKMMCSKCNNVHCVCAILIWTKQVSERAKVTARKEMEVNSNLKELWREKDLIDDQIKCLVAELENVIYAYKNVVKLKAEVEEELVKALKQKEELILELAKYNDR